MKAMLHGYRRVDMTDRDTGRVVQGYSCYISYPSDGIVGVETAKQWISDDMARACNWAPEVNCYIDLDFTPRGRVCGVVTVKDK